MSLSQRVTAVGRGQAPIRYTGQSIDQAGAAGAVPKFRDSAFGAVGSPTAATPPAGGVLLSPLIRNIAAQNAALDARRVPTAPVAVAPQPTTTVIDPALAGATIQAPPSGGGPAKTGNAPGGGAGGKKKATGGTATQKGGQGNQGGGYGGSYGAGDTTSKGPGGMLGHI